MKRHAIATATPTAPDITVTLLVGVLATVLLLVLNATRVLAQPMAFAAHTTAAIAPATNTARATSVDSLPRGKARMTWPKATRALQRGETLHAQDFVLVDTVVVWQWKDASSDTMTAVTGWITRRPIAQGEFMRPPSIAPANAIILGSTVHVIYQDGPVRLTLTGTATNNAALGAPVGVRLDKNRRLDGIAVGPNTVRLR